MKFRKKPVVIDAQQFFIFNKGYEQEQDELCTKLGVYQDTSSSTGWSIDTLEGKHEVSGSDFIITGVKGEKYPCKPDIFEMTYEKVEEL